MCQAPCGCSIARALGTLDLPAYPSLDAFAADLGRFAAEDRTQCIRELVRARTELRIDVAPDMAVVPGVIRPFPVKRSPSPIFDVRGARPG